MAGLADGQSAEAGSQTRARGQSVHTTATNAFTLLARAVPSPGLALALRLLIV